MAKPSSNQSVLSIVGAAPERTPIMARELARVAARLFSERGYEATSVREIVQAAGVTKPTLYYHFKSKEGLAHALLVEPQARLVERMRVVLDSVDEPIETLVELLNCLFEFCRDDPDRARLMFAVFFGPLGAGLASQVKRCGWELDSFWLAAVNRLVAAGQVDQRRAVEFELAVRGLHVIYILEFLYKDRQLQSTLAREIVTDLLRGFAPAVGSVDNGRSSAAPGNHREVIGESS